MAIIDSKLEFSDNQSVAAVGSSADTISTNVIDLGASGEDGFGNALANQLDGQDIRLNVQIGTAIAGNTLLVKLYTYSTTTVTSGQEVARLKITTTDGVANAKFSIGVPSDFPWLQYAGLGYRGSGGALSAGVISGAWLGGAMETKNTIPPTA